MKLQGQTPLTKAFISDDQQQMLRSLWIESVEEAIAVSAALSDSEEALEKVGLKALAASPATLQAVASERLSQVRTARQGGGLGCLPDEQVLQDFRQMGRLRPARAAPSGAFEAKLPNAVRLIDQMPPVRDQGQRGTCVAFESVALREFLLGSRTDLSEQFLYWACKELDGHPGPGTYIHTAMTAFAQYGVCDERNWPYNPCQTSDEGQGPPPAGAREDALRFRLDSARTVEPNLVVHYRQVLAGGSGHRGMPVTFGTLVFNSWYMSSETHRTGKITLPLPGENPAGGHAWCVVGYVDDEDVPGGGYFIVRNSWGTGWAANSPEAAGHALMPYRYVENFAFEAFTGPGTMPEIFWTKEDVDRGYVRYLTEEEADLDGMSRAPQTAVLCHPSEPQKFRVATSDNWHVFVSRNKTWTPEALRRVWFPASPERSISEAGAYRALRQSFIGAVHKGVYPTNSRNRDLVLPMPIANSIWRRLLAWEPRVRHVRSLPAEDTNVFAADLARAIAARSGAPHEVSLWPKDWISWLSEVNAPHIYALSTLVGVIHVVAVTPVAVVFDSPGRASLVAPCQQTVDLLLDIYSGWSSKTGNKASFVLFTVGSFFSLAPQTAGYIGPNHGVVASSLHSDGTWTVSSPDAPYDKKCMRRFFGRLRPDWGQIVDAIKRYVDHLLDMQYAGSIHVAKISRDTGIDPVCVEDALFTLRDNFPRDYRVSRFEGKTLIGNRDGKIGRTIHSFTQAHYLSRLACLGPAAGVAIWSMKDVILGRPFEGWGFAAMIPLAYAGEWLNTRFRKWREDKE